MPKSKVIEEAAVTRKRREGPRTPSRRRGVVRYTALLDATDELLQTEDPGAVGLYQIAERAGVPPASVYHFFPTKEAAYVALAERFFDGLLEVHSQPFPAAELHSWQDLYRIDLRRGADFYNRHPPAMKILYGGSGGVEAREIDKLVTMKMAGSAYDRMNRVFHMPYVKDPERRFEVRIGILDAIWTISVRRHGRITDDYLAVAYNACVAYARLFLPEFVEPRDELLAAAARGESISLPFRSASEDAGAD